MPRRDSLSQSEKDSCSLFLIDVFDSAKGPTEESLYRGMSEGCLSSLFIVCSFKGKAGELDKRLVKAGKRPDWIWLRVSNNQVAKPAESKWKLNSVFLALTQSSSAFSHQTWLRHR